MELIFSILSSAVAFLNTFSLYIISLLINYLFILVVPLNNNFLARVSRIDDLYISIFIYQTMLVSATGKSICRPARGQKNKIENKET